MNERDDFFGEPTDEYDAGSAGRSTEDEEAEETPEEEPPLYEETQQPPWVALVFGLGAPAVGVLAAARALSLVARFGAAALAVGGLGMVFSEFLFPMTTKLYPEEIHVRFGRRTRFRVPLKNVMRAYARTYDPLAEYGGWGIRGVGRNRAFNIQGNLGVQLVLRSGQKLLIGSDRPEELAYAIRKATGCEGAPEG